MLRQPTTDNLLAMRLFGMAEAFTEQTQQDIYCSMTFEERFGLIVDRELARRSSHQLTIRLRKAKLRQEAAYEDIDFRISRGLDRANFLWLCEGQWIERHENCLVTGPTGVGKSYIACALANKACRDGRRVLYARAPRLFSELSIARVDGSLGRRLLALARVELLVLDDWGLAPVTGEHGRDFLEILDDRYDRRSTIVVSQLPVDQWHKTIPDPTIADAAMDRLIHNAHRIALSGESSRKRRASGTGADIPCES